MIVLLGASGYIGQAFTAELKRRNWPFQPLARSQIDYTRFDVLLDYLRSNKPAFLINAAGYTGKPNVDACELARAETLLGNTAFPQAIAQACCVTATPWGHVSSGCIYNGAKIMEQGRVQVKSDLTEPGLQPLLQKNSKDILGFSETDDPNFSFRQPPCSFYSGTKALAEEIIMALGQAYVWRLRIPFDEQDHSRNFLSKVQRYAKVYDNVNSLSQRGDFVRACLDLWERRAPVGIYNVTNPGYVSTRQVVAMMQRILKPGREFEFWTDDSEFYRVGAKTPRSNCVLDNSKLLATGVAMRPVEEALEQSLKGWKPGDPARS
jgi:dTDP-4-dehydrorhamnose reductase